MNALRKADAAATSGDESAANDARRLAAIIKRMDTQQPTPTPTPAPAMRPQPMQPAQPNISPMGGTGEFDLSKFRALPKTQTLRLGGPSGSFPGMLSEGNIDLGNRPQVKNADGSVSSVRSMSFGTDNGEVLVPTVSEDGRIMSNQEAMDQYRKTGRHLGTFKTPDEANSYAEALHQAQANFKPQGHSKPAPAGFLGATMPARARQDGWTPEQWAAVQRAQNGSQDHADRMAKLSWDSYNRDLPKSAPEPESPYSTMFKPARMRKAEDAVRAEIDNPGGEAKLQEFLAQRNASRNGEQNPVYEASAYQQEPVSRDAVLGEIDNRQREIDNKNLGLNPIRSKLDDYLDPLGKGVTNYVYNIPGIAANVASGTLDMARKAVMEADISSHRNPHHFYDPKDPQSLKNQLNEAAAATPGTPDERAAAAAARWEDKGGAEGFIPQVQLRNPGLAEGLTEGIGQFVAADLALGPLGISKASTFLGKVRNLALNWGRDNAMVGAVFSGEGGRASTMLKEANIKTPEQVQAVIDFLAQDTTNDPLKGRMLNVLENLLTGNILPSAAKHLVADPIRKGVTGLTKAPHTPIDVSTVDPLKVAIGKETQAQAFDTAHATGVDPNALPTLNRPGGAFDPAQKDAALNPHLPPPRITPPAPQAAATRIPGGASQGATQGAQGQPIPPSTAQGAGAPPIQPPVTAGAGAAVPTPGAPPPAGNLVPIPRNEAVRAYNALPPKTRKAMLRTLNSAGKDVNSFWSDAWRNITGRFRNSSEAMDAIRKLGDMPEDQQVMFALELIKHNGGDLETILPAMGRKWAVEGARDPQLFGGTDRAREIMDANVPPVINGQGERVAGLAEQRFGPGIVPAGEAIDVEKKALAAQYDRILNPNRSQYSTGTTGQVKNPEKRAAIDKAIAGIKSYLKRPEVIDEMPDWVKMKVMTRASEDMRNIGFTDDQKAIILAGDGAVLAPLFEASGPLKWSPKMWAHLVEQYPTQAAHVLQSAYREAADGLMSGVSRTQADVTNAKYLMRLRGESGKGGLLDLLENAITGKGGKVDGENGYQWTRKNFGDNRSAERAFDILDRFKTAVNSEGDVAAIITELKDLPARHREAAENQITSLIRQELGRKVDNAKLSELNKPDRLSAPNLTALGSQNFLNALEDVFGPRGKELADGIRLARATTDTLTSISPKYNSRTQINSEDVAKAGSRYEDPAGSDNGILDRAVGALASSGVATGAAGILGMSSAGALTAPLLGLAAGKALYNAYKACKRLSNDERNQLVDFLFRARKAGDGADLPDKINHGNVLGSALAHGAVGGVVGGLTSDGDPGTIATDAALAAAFGVGRKLINSHSTLIKPEGPPSVRPRRGPPPFGGNRVAGAGGSPQITPPGSPPVQAGFFGGGRKGPPVPKGPPTPKPPIVKNGLGSGQSRIIDKPITPAEVGADGNTYPEIPAKSQSSKLLDGMGGSPSGYGAAGGALLGGGLNLTDANGDGVIDDADRGFNAMGGLISGALAGHLGGAALNKLTGRRVEIPKGSNGIDQATFGGVRGARTLAEKGEKRPMQAINMAINMAEKGATRDAIWDATAKHLEGTPYIGVFKGADGQWKFEIDDSTARVTLPETHAPYDHPAPFKGTLSGLIDDASSGGAYPDMADIRTVGGFGQNRGRTGGTHLPAGPFNDEMISVTTGKNPDDVRSVLLHEKQHGIQERDNFGRGDNPNVRSDKRALSGPAASDYFQASYIRRGAERDGLTPVEWLERLHDAQKSNPKTWTDIGSSVGDRPLIHGYPLRPGAEKLLTDDAAFARLDQRYVEGNPSARYQRSSGEVEARNVQTRRDMTPAERRAKRPWETQDVPDDKQIVRRDAVKSASSDIGEDKPLSEIIHLGKPIEPGTKRPSPARLAEAMADTRASGAATAERMDAIIPEADRVVGGVYTPGAPGGSRWTDLSPKFLATKGPGFKVTDDELRSLWNDAVAGSSQAAKNAVAEHNVVPTFLARDWDKAMNLPYRDMLWYELSGEAFGQNLPDLTAKEFIHAMDVVGATSARAKPGENLERSLASMSLSMQGRPIDVDLTQPQAVAQALTRKSLGTSALPGNKTGHFSDTLALTGGVPTRFPISVNDVWVGKMFGISDKVMSAKQALHEPMALYFNRLRDLYNERHGAQITKDMKAVNPQIGDAPFNLQSWNFQAPAWVHLRNEPTGDAYHQVWDGIINKLKAAGIPGIHGQKITREALMHPGFADALRKTASPWRSSYKATIEFGTKLTNVGNAARERYDRAVAAGDVKTQQAYLKPIMGAMYESARGKNKPWDLLAHAITGRKQSITRIDYATADHPLDVGGSFDGALSPNIRIPLKGMKQGEIEDFNAVVGEDFWQEAMAASRVLPADTNVAPRPGHTRGLSLFVPTTERMSPVDIQALAQALDAEGHTFSYNRYPNGYQFDVNPNFGADGVQTGISSQKLNDAFNKSIGTDKYGSPKLIPHDYKSEYTESKNYAARIAAISERITDEFAEATGLTKAQAQRDLAGTRAPDSYSGADKRAWNTARRRVDNLALARTKFKELAQKVADGHADFLEKADRREARARPPANKPSGPPKRKAPLPGQTSKASPTAAGALVGAGLGWAAPADSEDDRIRNIAIGTGVMGGVGALAGLKARPYGDMAPRGGRKLPPKSKISPPSRQGSGMLGNMAKRAAVGAATGAAVNLANDAGAQDDIAGEIRGAEGRIKSAQQEIASLKKAKSDFDKITDPFEKQRFLKAQGLYAGKIEGNIAGATTDGINAWDAKNAAAIEGAEKDLAASKSELTEMRKRDAQRQMQKEQNPFFDSLRELGPSGAGLLAGVAASVLRFRGVGKSAKAVKIIENDINDLLTSGPVKRLMAKGGANNQSRNRAVNMNQFYREGGAPDDKLPFKYGARGWSYNSNSAKPGTLFPKKHLEEMDGVGPSRVRQNDIKVVAAGLLDSAVVTPFVSNAETELNDAEADAKNNPDSVEAMRRVERAKTNLALFQGIQRLGWGVAGGGIISTAYKYKLPKMDIRGAEDEVTQIADYLKSQMPPKPPKSPTAIPKPARLALPSAQLLLPAQKPKKPKKP